ncbi:MAG: rod shape-determining protein RodA [Kiritimatiellae bacterium]|nr:rod shape-determining protein RodA [Kiritimatiellia bacterium]
MVSFRKKPELPEWLKAFARIDFAALLLVLGLLATGLCFVYSASYRGEATGIVGSWFRRQVFWGTAGLAASAVLLAVGHRALLRLSGWIYLASLVLLFAVLIAGKRIFGAVRWLEIGGFQLQPSEFAKLALVLVLARMLSLDAFPARRFWTVLAAAGLTAAPFALVMLEPDLGTAVVFPVVAAAMLFAAGMAKRWIFAAGGLALAAAPLGWFVLGDYQRDRILTFLDPSRDPLGTGWNALQSTLAVGSGGMYGKGFLQGTQNVLGFLPRTVSPSDFIFPVLAEEKGFAGGAMLLAAYALLLFCYLRTAARAKTADGALLAVGVAAVLFFHVFVNIAMTIGLMPITGLPLPLVSSGGTFMVCTLAGFGLVESVRARETA